MITELTDFNYKDCDKLPGGCVAGFVGLKIDEQDPTKLILESSWGESAVDMTLAIRAAETKTTLLLSPVGAPTALLYNAEGGPISIAGEDLSRIIHMKYLADVDQSHGPATGDIYLYDDGMFRTFAFNTWKNTIQGSINTINNRLDNIEPALIQVTNDVSSLTQKVNSIQTNLTNEINARKSTDTNLQNQINTINGSIATLTSSLNNLTSRVAALEALLVKPTGAPSNAKVAWGNINVYSDNTNAGLKTSGLYTHATSSNVTNDLSFA